MSILHSAKEVAEAVSHHIPKPVADELKAVLRKIEPAAWHFFLREVAPVADPLTDIFQSVYDLVPDGPAKQKAEEELKEAAHLYWEAFIDKHTEQDGNDE